MTMGKNDRISPQITTSVIDAMEAAPNERLQEIMTALIRHLHDVVREVRLSEQEWALAIDFLTQTGQMCSDKRQEFILLSDTLGVSMLVDAINHHDGGVVTPSTIFGPFYAGLQQELAPGASILRREEDGESVLVEGVILNRKGEPIQGALIEVWQTAPCGRYDVQDAAQPEGHLRGSFRSASDGSYGFRTVLPVSYSIPDDGPVGRMLGALGRHPNRPAHIHFMISAPGYRTLVTHIFVAGDAYLESDAVFGVKPELIVAPDRKDEGCSLRYDFRLANAGSV